MSRYFLVLTVILAFIYLNRIYAHFYDFQGDNFIPNPSYPHSHLISKDRKAETAKLMVLGDSLMAGTGSTNEENSLAYLIASKLTDTQNINLINMASPGVGVSDVLNRQVPEVIKEQPDYVLVMIGTNDVHNIVSSGNFRKMYDQVLKELTSNTKARITIINIPYIGSDKIVFSPWDKILDYRITEFNKIIDKLAEDNGLSVVNLNAEFRDKFRKSSDLYSHDQFHPSDKGYALWAEYISSHLTK